MLFSKIARPQNFVDLLRHVVDVYSKDIFKGFLQVFVTWLPGPSRGKKHVGARNLFQVFKDNV